MSGRGRAIRGIRRRPQVTSGRPSPGHPTRGRPGLRQPTGKMKFNRLTRSKGKVPEEDKEYLNLIGYDVLKEIGFGIFGYVFKGSCNENSRITVPVPRSEVKRDSRGRLLDPYTYYWDIRRNSWMKLVSNEGNLCAIKMFKDFMNKSEKVYEELNAIKYMYHPNIVQVYYVCRTRTNMYLIMEYINGGTIGDRISNRMEFDEVTGLRIIKEIVDAIHYMHKNRIVHGDLHKGNVMLAEHDNTLIAKIVDLGSAKTLRSSLDSDSDARMDIKALYRILFDIARNTQFDDREVFNRLKQFFDMLKHPTLQTMDEVVAQMEVHMPQPPPPSQPPTSQGRSLRDALRSRLSKFFRRK